MDDEQNVLYDDSDRSESLGVNKIQGIERSSGIQKILGNTIPQDYKPASSKPTYLTDGEDAKQEGELQYETGVIRVADSPEAEEFLNIKQLYEKTLGVTEYDELRAKLHLKDNESFTDYYNRTHYVPEGFQMQAKLLLAEEKRKKLYAEMEAGKMSEEDFLYEAYGKDLLKQEGIDFSSSLYWYNRRRNKQYEDPRQNSTFMLQLIEQSRELYQEEKWYEQKSKKTLSDTLAGIATGVELPAGTIEELFQDQFDALTETVGDRAQIIKYYRAGLLQGFDPTIDKDGDGKIDYYLSTDGKLYNVNETGEGANTFKIYYKKDANGNYIMNPNTGKYEFERITAHDSVAGEVVSEFFKGIGRFFTDVVDLFALVVGGFQDLGEGIFTGKWDTSAITNNMATMNEFWNSTALGDHDLIQGSAWSGANAGRSVARLGGTIVAFAATAFIGAAVGAATTAGKAGATAATTGVKTAVAAGVKKTAAQKVGAWLAKLGSKKVFQTIPGKAVKFIGKYAVTTATSLTSWSNGAFGTGLGARLGTSAMLATRDFLTSTATLAINQKTLGLSDSEVVSHAFQGAAINFGASLLLRQVADEGALKAWSKVFNSTKKATQQAAAGAIFKNTAPTLWQKITGRTILDGTISGGAKIGVGIANTIMDQVENIITAGTQTSLVQTGEVWNWDAIGNMIISPQFLVSSLYQTKMALSDELKYDSKKLMGAIADTSRMDQEFRAYIANAKANIKDINSEEGAKQLQALNGLLADYDITIKNKCTETNPNTEQQYTRAEATLFALEKVVKGVDMDVDSEFIQTQKSHLDKVIRDKKLLYTQAVFNSLEEDYKAYNQLVQDGWKGHIRDNLKAHWWYGKESANLYKHFEDMTSKYMAIPLDMQIMYDTYGEDGYYDRLFKATSELSNLDKLDNVSTSSIITGVSEKDGVYTVHTKFDKGETNGFTQDEAIVFKQKIIDEYGLTPDTGSHIVISLNDPDGKSKKQAQLPKVRECLDATAEAFAKLNGLDPNNNPLLVKISDTKYVIPNFNLGNTLELNQKVGSLLKCMIHLKFNKSLTPKEQIRTISLILQHAYGHEKGKKDIDILNEHLSDIPELINAITGESSEQKVFSKVEAARLLVMIKHSLKDGKTLPLPEQEGKNTNNTYNRVYDIVKIQEEYTKVQEALEVIRKGQLDSSSKNKEDTTQKFKDSKEYIKAISDIQKFKETYIKLKDDALLETELLQDCFDGHLFTRDAIQAIGEIPFQLDLKDQQLLNHYLENLETYSLKRGEVSEEEYRSFLRFMINKLGVTPDAGLEDTASLQKFVSEILTGRKATKKSSVGVTKKQRTAIIDTLTPLFKQDTITKESIAEFRTAIKNSDIDNQTKQDLLKDIGSVASIKAKALEKIISAYNPKNHKAEAATIRNIEGYATDPIGTAIKYLDKKYGATLQQYKTVEDIFTEKINKYREVTKLCDENYIVGKNVLVLDLTTMLGTEGEKVARKLSGDSYNDYMKAETPEAKEGIAFADSKTKAAFREEQMKLHSLYASRANSRAGDYVLVFDLDNTTEVARAKKLIKDIYNFNGDIVYMAGKGEHPGVHLLSDAFIGFTLSNKNNALHDLYVAAIKAQKTIENKVDMVKYSDPLALLESFASGYTFIDEGTELKDSSKLIFNTLQELDPDNIDYNDINYVNSLSSWVNYINVKLGKLAGNKVKEIAIKHSGIHLSTPENIRIKQKLFVYKAIEAISKLYPQENPKDNINVAVNTIKVKLNKKELEDAQTIWAVDTIDESKGLYYLNPRADISAEEFKTKAYELLTTYKKGKTNIFKILVPLAEGESLQNGMLRKSASGNVLATQETNGYTPYSIIDKELRGFFTEEDIDNYLLTLTAKEIGGVDFTAKALKEAEEELKKYKTPKEILNISSDNFFIQMHKNAVAASLVVSKTIKESLQALFPETYETIYKTLGDKDNRRNLAIAIRQNLSKAKFDEDGYLEVTDALVSSVLNSIKDIHSNPDKKNGENFIYDSNYNTLTGSQTSLLTADNAKMELTAEGLKDLLNVLDITKQELISSEHYEDNPLMKFYAMCKAASDKDKVQISLQDLYSLTKQDIKDIEEPLINIIGKESYKKIKDTIDKIYEETDPTVSNLRPNKLSSAEIKRVSRDDEVVIQTEGESIKKTHKTFYDRAIARLHNRRHQDNFVKLADIQAIESNIIMSQMLADINNSKALVTKNLGSSTILNMNRAENVAAMFYTINDFARKLESLNMGENKLTRQDSLDLAWNLMLYSTGTQFESNYPEFIFYDKKNRRIVNDGRASIAVSGDKYSNPYDNLIANIYNDYMKEDGTLDLDNIIILSADRNSFATLYTESPSNFRYLDMDMERYKIEELLNDSIKDFLISKGLTSDSKRKITDEEKISEYSKYLYSALNRTQAEFNRESARLSKDISIKGSIESLNADPSDLSFIGSRNNSLEELFSGLKEKILATTNWNNRNKQQSKYQKTKDFVSFGITNDIFNSYSDLSNELSKHTSVKRKETVNNLVGRTTIQDRKQLLQLRTDVDRILRHITDAFDSGDSESFNIGIENLCSKLSTNKLKVSKEDIVSDVITYFIASSPYLENKIFMTLDGDYKLTKSNITTNMSPDFVSVKTLKGKTVQSKKYTKAELLKASKLAFDFEAAYGDGITNPFELGIALGHGISTDTESAVLYFKIPGIDTSQSFESVIKQLRENKHTAEYMIKYYDKESGAQTSIRAWYDFWNNTDSYRADATHKFNEVLEKAVNSKAILFGYNSENFDIPLLVKQLDVGKKSRDLNSYGIDIVLMEKLLDNRFDILNMVKGTAKYKEVNIESGGLSQSAMLKMYNLSDEGAHGAISDTSNLLKLTQKLIDDTIDTNRYQYNIIDTIETLYKAITGKTSIPEDFDLTGLRIKHDELSEETLSMIKQLQTFRQDNNRLSKIQEYINYANLRSNMNYSDIKVKEHKEVLYANRAGSDIKFAKRFKTVESREGLFDILSCAITNKIKDNTTKGLKVNTDSILLDIVNKVLPSDSIKSLQDYEEALSLSREELKARLNIDEEDIKEWRATKESKDLINLDYFDIRDTLDYNGMNEMRDSLFMRTANNSILNSVEPILTDLDNLPIDSKVKNFIQNELFRFFDIDKDHVHAIKDNNGNTIGYKIPEANNNRVADFLSNLDDKLIDFFFTDPITSITYDSLYEEAQTVPLNRKIKFKNTKGTASIEDYLEDGTIAVSQSVFDNLFNQRGTSVSQEAIKKSMGLHAKDDLYIAIPRHPLDKTDSFHFLKVVVLDDAYAKENGFNTLINVDTMKTWMNGDLDGDHLTILKPTKEMQTFANTTDGVNTLIGLQQQPLKILSDIKRSIVNSKFNIEAEQDYPFIRAIHKDSKIKDLLVRYGSSLEAATKAKSGDISKTYSDLKNKFTDDIKEYLKLVSSNKKRSTGFGLNNKIISDNIDKYADLIVKELFYCEPVEVSQTLNGKRFVYFSNAESLVNDKNNYENKLLSRLSELSTYGILSLNDTITGTIQKKTHSETTIYKDMRLAQNIIRISESTKRLIDSNASSVDLQSLKLLTPTFTKAADSIISSDLRHSDKVERLLSLIQIESMKKMHPLAIKATETFHATDTPEARAYRMFTSDETNDEIFSTYKDIFNTKKKLSQSFASNNSEDLNKHIIRAIRYNNAENKASVKDYSDVYTDMRLLVSKVEKDAPVEDTIRVLSGLNNKEGVKTDIVKSLRPSDIQALKNLKGQEIRDKRLIERLGYDSTNTTIRLKVIDTYEDSVAISRHISIKGQKIVTSDTDATKGTLTVKGSVPSSLDSQYDLLLGNDQWSPKKMFKTESDQDIQKEYYDINGQLLKNVTNENDGRVAYIGYTGKVNLAECSGLWNKTRKPTSFEELSNGNNIDSIGGIFLYRGNGYYVGEDNTLNFNNEALTSRLKEINEINTPARYEHNGMYNYLLLKLSYAIKALDDTTLSKLHPSYTGNKSELISDLIKTNGFIGLNNYIEGKLRPFFKYKLKDADKTTKAILSKELNNFMLEDIIKDAIAKEGVTSDSNRQYPGEVRKTAEFLQEREAGGQLIDILNGNYKASVKGFKSNIDFINKFLDLSGQNKVITRDKIREAETYGQLANGVIYRRTQTSGGTRRLEDTPNISINNRMSTTNVKTGTEFETPFINVNAPTTALRLTDSQDLDLDTFYKQSNELLGNRGGNNSQILNYYNSKKKGDTPISLDRVKYLLTVLANKEGSEISILSDTTPKYSRTISSYAKPSLALDENGNATFKASRHFAGEKSFIESYEDSKRIGRSNIFFDYARKFEEANKNKIASTLPNIDQDNLEYKNKVYESLIDLSNNFSNLEADPDKDLIQSEINNYFSNYPTTLEDVKNRADTSFYSGDSTGEIKHFKTELLKLNNNIALHDEKDLIADRCLKNLGTESSAKEQQYSVDLIRLNQVAIRNGSEEAVNKFAYILALHNKLDVIEFEKSKSGKNSRRYQVLLEAEEDIKHSLTTLGITDSKKYIADFEKVHTEEARMLYVILRSLNFEAEKYSKLCGEPGNNIFFLLTPSTKNTRTAEKAKASYVISMLAKGNNPATYDSSTDTFTYSKVPVYDGYNFFSSLGNSITAISKQAAIYENSIRMKQAGFMNSAAIQNTLYSCINDESIQESLQAFKYTDTHKEQLNLLLTVYKDKFSDDPSMLKQINIIENHINKDNHYNPERIGQAYQDLFKVMNAYINTSEMSIEDAVDILNSTPKDTQPNDIYYNQANKTVLAYNMYSDLLAQLSYFTNDKLSDMIYNKIVNLLGEDTRLVDRFGRIQDKDSIYALSENSLEYLLDAVDKFYGDTDEIVESKYKQSIVSKALKGELYLMDATLADTLADRVFVKKDPGKIKSTLQKTSSWCTKWLMSNPFKLIDRFIKFTMFDTTALSTANHHTLFKQPQAMMDLRTYFSTKGAVSTDNLNEFLYTQGIKLNANNIGKIFNNNDTNAGFNPLSTYTDAVGNVFTYQTLATRYAYWLATKEALEKGDYSVLGSAYYLKSQMDSMKGLETEELVVEGDQPTTKKRVVVTKAGEQAAFAMAQNLGAPGDFPDASRRLSNYGAVFTSFPLALLRWGIGEFRSLGSALQDIFISGNPKQGIQWMGRNGGGILMTFIIEQFLISMIADMFHVDEETEEEWKETGAIPNITQTLATGTPIMDTFNSMNMARELYGLTAEPFVNKDNSEDSNIASGFERYFYKNILSHINPLAKNAVEVVTNKDLIDDQIIDTKDKYSMLENVFRKMSGYVIGAAGANAMVKEFNNGKDSSLIDNFANGISAAISAEVGNTKAYKGNVKNYYKSLKTLNNYLYSGNTGLTSSMDTGDLKSQIYQLISKEAKISDIYSLLLEFNKQGYSPEQIRSAMRSCSISYKLNYIKDLEDLRQHINNSDFANLKTAVAFENAMYPWLNESIDYLDDWIKENSYNYDYNNTYLNLYTYKPKAIYNNYNESYSNPNIRNSKSNYDYYTKNPFEVYNQSQSNLQYQQQQAEYARQRKQWEDN